jgi:hypothetical protein
VIGLRLHFDFIFRIVDPLALLTKEFDGSLGNAGTGIKVGASVAKNLRQLQSAATGRTAS